LPAFRARQHGREHKGENCSEKYSHGAAASLHRIHNSPIQSASHFSGEAGRLVRPFVKG
jgi:hypothetical protein